MPAELHLPGQAGNSSCCVSRTDGQGWDRRGDVRVHDGLPWAGGPGDCHLFSSLGVTVLVCKASPNPALLDVEIWEMIFFYPAYNILNKIA